MFAKPKLSIEVDYKTRKGIANLIIKTELKNKHRIKNQLKNEIQGKTQQLQEKMSFLLFNTIRFKIRTIVNSRKKKWSVTHKRKLEILRKEVSSYSTKKKNVVIPNIIHNFSSYNLSVKEVEVLSYSLDHYMSPGKEMGKRTQVEFERFFQELAPHTTELAAQEKIELKSKFLDTFNKYPVRRSKGHRKSVQKPRYNNFTAGQR